MATYTVAVPMTGVIYVQVQAESEEEALGKALDSEQLTLENLEEWEAHKQITRGNVLYAIQNEIEVVEVSE